MANRHRGEVGVDWGGRRYTLCLTLGALAELEDAFGAADLAALGERLAGGRLSARDLIAIIRIALRAGGHPLTDAEIAALPVNGGIEPYAEAVAALFEAAFGAGRSETPPNP